MKPEGWSEPEKGHKVWGELGLCLTAQPHALHFSNALGLLKCGGVMFLFSVYYRQLHLCGIMYL